MSLSTLPHIPLFCQGFAPHHQYTLVRVSREIKNSPAEAGLSEKNCVEIFFFILQIGDDLLRCDQLRDGELEQQHDLQRDGELEQQHEPLSGDGLEQQHDLQRDGELVQQHERLSDDEQELHDERLSDDEQQFSSVPYFFC